MKKNYDVCLFDLDGTLIDSLRDLADSCNEALTLFGLPKHDVDEYRFLVGSGIKNLIKKAMGESAADEQLSRSVFDKFNTIYGEKCLDATRPYDGITEMLEALKASGVKIGILSNKSDEFAKRIVDTLFDSSLIDLVYGKREEFPVKPAPDSLYAMLSELDIADKSRCLYIGDSNVDVKTALNGGVAFCGAQWGFRGREELENAGAEFIAETADDITKHVLCGE